MDRRRGQGLEKGDRGKGHRKKAAPGLRVVERDGHWHIAGTLRVAGRSRRIRKSTELPADERNRDFAEALKLQIEQDARNEAVHGIKPSVPFAVAADSFLNQRRARPLNPVDIARIQELTVEFGIRTINTLTDEDWNAFIDRRHASNTAQTRERYLNIVVGFLSWCRKRPRQWIAALPHFERDKAARRRRAVSRRRVIELTPDLVALMIECASPHMAAQLAVEWSTGARVSSILSGCRFCDLQLAPGREQITFHETKTGEPVTSSLHPWAVQVLRGYIEWRGVPKDREGALFLTHRMKPYKDNGKGYGTQNKTGFNGMKRRAAQALRDAAAKEAIKLRAAGLRDEARAWIDQEKGRADLIGQVTQHWFRHLLATQMLSKGADIRSVMEQGGWLDASSVLIYGHDVPERRRELVNLLDTEGPSAARPDSASIATRRG
ncbi:tyrosine-type recombinase/integrase [Azospirillum agricola]|uniref:tyrosine-type recombinase/integrase n=1 Tax=Azospirillum agricola TaxID=1720247 RepID=UPI000A0EF313|nr:tyrosine-type recombinase/integrase [Azospirillum agricola]SMH29468.1 Site-specific recombinase XerD [Azospirillum lipoferum]